MAELHVVAGPNGVGKTTAFATIVPKGVDYINADLIAKTIKLKAGGLNTMFLFVSTELTFGFAKAVIMSILI